MALTGVEGVTVITGGGTGGTGGGGGVSTVGDVNIRFIGKVELLGIHKLLCNLITPLGGPKKLRLKIYAKSKFNGPNGLNDVVKS